MDMSVAAPGACTKRDLHVAKPVNKVQQQVQQGFIQSALASGKSFATAQVRAPRSVCCKIGCESVVGGHHCCWDNS